MAHRKAGGTVKNLHDSQPKYLGIKVGQGGAVKPGMIIVRQRGTRFTAGANVGLGKDHTIFATRAGLVNFSKRQKTSHDGNRRTINEVSVISPLPRE